jgi:hypothetical protein
VVNLPIMPTTIAGTAGASGAGPELSVGHAEATPHLDRTLQTVGMPVSGLPDTLPEGAMR